MVLARFEFYPDKAEQFAWHSGQQIVEVLFDNVFDLIKTCQEYEDAIANCTAMMDGQIIDLRAFSA